MDRRKWIWTLAVIGYVAFIFRNSMTPAAESSRQSGAVLALVRDWLHAVGLNGSWVTEHLIRKTAHFVEYAFLGMLLWNCLGSYGLQCRVRLMAQAWLGTAIPLIDETIQLFTEGRSGQVSDVWLDMAGVAAGLCVAFVACDHSHTRDRTANPNKKGR